MVIVDSVYYRLPTTDYRLVMIALVIPAIRTPRGITGFDYEIPEGMDVQIGDLVRIPFRRSEIVGIVAQIQSTTTIKTPLKAILGSFHELHFSEQIIQLLQQLSERSFTSPPSVLHAWLGKLPKKSGTRDTGHGIQATRHPDNPTPRQPLFLQNHLHHPEGVIASAKKAITDGKRVLILTPWSARAEEIAKQFETHGLTSDIASGKRFRLWNDFIQGTTSILVATRIGAWCGIAADLIIMDEPENDDHKQDELSPRYDARWIAAYLQSKGTDVLSIGLTPKLTQVYQASLDQIPAIQTDIQYIDTHYADWSDIPGIQGRSLLVLEDAIQKQRPCFIIHPIYGDQARLRCKDCGWTASCDQCGAGMIVEKGMLRCRRCLFKKSAIIECPSCGSTQFANSKPGALKIKETIQKKSISNVEVLSINEWNARETIPMHSLVILTDLQLLAGAREDLRKKEQMIIAWRRLADICESHQSTLIVQSDPETITQAKAWLDGDGCVRALQKEIEDRNTFQLPPTTRLTKLIFRGNQGHAERVLDLLRQRIKSTPGLHVSGPFAVQFRPSHREARWIGHLTAPLSIPVGTIIKTLMPLAEQTDTLIDLDPIAFFE